MAVVRRALPANLQCQDVVEDVNHAFGVDKNDNYVDQEEVSHGDSHQTGSHESRVADLGKLSLQVGLWDATQQEESRGDLLLHDESDGNGHVLSDPEGGDQVERSMFKPEIQLFQTIPSLSHLTVVGTLTGISWLSRLLTRASMRHV